MQCYQDDEGRGREQDATSTRGGAVR